MNRSILLAGVLVALGAFVPAGQDARPDFSRPSPPLNDLMTQLRSPDSRQRDDARRLLLAQRRAVLWTLQSTILQRHKIPEQREVVALAIRLLAELGADESVPTLVEVLDFDDLNRIEVARPFAVAPQLEALMQLGLPALDPLVKKIATSADPSITERATRVICGILGKDFALLYVEDRIRRQKGTLEIERLVRVKDRISQLPRGESTVGGLHPSPVVSPGKERK